MKKHYIMDVKVRENGKNVRILPRSERELVLESISVYKIEENTTRYVELLRQKRKVVKIRRLFSCDCCLLC
jgi:hypothetical protein